MIIPPALREKPNMRRLLLAALAAACLTAPPASAGEAVRVMAFGDSLTKGTGSSHGAGYRLAFVRHMQDAGYPVDMLGTFHHGPKDLDRDHQGHQGQGVAKLDEVSFDELRRERPEVVILMIGTNDAKEGSFVPEAFRIRYSVLLDRILAESRTKLIAATIPPARYGRRSRVIGPLNAIVRSEVAKRAEAGKSVRLVDVYEMIDARADFVDPLHLNDAAYARVGDAFAETLIAMLPPAVPAAAATAEPASGTTAAPESAPPAP
jgi:lysophospholipase L1-like esterase